MNTENFEIIHESSIHFDAVEKLGEVAFGPGRFARTAFRLREGVAQEDELSFVALKDKHVVGSVRVTRIMIGTRPGLVLGPLVVDPDHKNEGLGNALMTRSIEACREMTYELVILVGDEPYYRSFGFKKIPFGQITLPGPVDPARFLYCELKDNALQKFEGVARASSTLNSVF